MSDSDFMPYWPEQMMVIKVSRVTIGVSVASPVASWARHTGWMLATPSPRA